MMGTDIIHSFPENAAPDLLATRVNRTRSKNPLESRTDDIEQAYALEKLGSQEEAVSFEDLTFAHIPDQLWHFCSVDYGERCK